MVQMKTVSLYIHWPFCLAKCPYCDFNSHVAVDIDRLAWQQAYLDELEAYVRLVEKMLDSPAKFIQLKTIFFGGGTPSLMPPAIIAAIIDKASSYFAPVSDIEITAEANPTSAETAKLKDFSVAGINRLSVGVQSLDTQGLAFLGREHSAKQAIKTLETARKYFSRISADLIYGLPHQDFSNWHRQLALITDICCDHLSCYQLTIEPGTPFYTRAQKGAILTQSPDQVADFYLQTEKFLSERAMPAYEISNYARNGQESRHNLNYWQMGNWLGLGPGAHGRWHVHTQRYSTINRRSPKGWLETVQQKGIGTDQAGFENTQACFEEYWMMGLRLCKGVEWPGPVATQYPEHKLNPHWLDIFIEQNWLELKQDRLLPTLEGRLRLDMMLRHLLD